MPPIHCVYRDMERTTRSLTLRQTSLLLLLIRASFAKHPGISVGDVDPPATVALPASDFLTTRFSLVKESVRVTERLFLVVLSSLVGFLFLASAISSGSRQSNGLEGTVVVADREDPLSVSEREAVMMHQSSVLSVTR